MIFQLSDQGLTLLPFKPDLIPYPAWQEFADHISEDPFLIPFSADTLNRRFQNGETTLILDKGRIISHLSGLNVLQAGSVKMADEEVAYFPELRSSLQACFLLTGWTHPSYRGKGLNWVIRKALIESCKSSGLVAFGVSRRHRVARLIQELDCEEVPYGEIPYVQALTWLSTRLGRTPRSDVANNQVLWISDLDSGRMLNSQISRSTGMSISEWHKMLCVETPWGT